jgi:membrane protein implicated in regulation of membrane protease activity
LLCKPADVARTPAGMYTLRSGGAVAIAIASGVLWDVTGVPATSFVPLAICAVALAAIAARMRGRQLA